MARIRGGLSAIITLSALAGGLVTATPAVAAAPTRVDDTVTAAYVDAADGDRQLDIAVFHSAEAGVQAFASLSGGPEGNHLADGEGAAEWTDTTFRATIELHDDDGAPAGTVTVGGTYAPDGEPDRNEQKFNDGNIRVRMDHTTTPLALGDVTVALDGSAWEITSGSGLQEVGSLFFTNPATFVNREEFVAHGEATVENMADHFIEGTLDELAITFEYADAQVHTGAAIDVTDGTWSGTFTLRNEDGDEIGAAAATATLTSLGSPTRLFDHVRGGYEKWTFTPYELVLTVDGPVAPARLTVEIAEVSYGVHTPPATGQHR